MSYEAYQGLIQVLSSTPAGVAAQHLESNQKAIADAIVAAQASIAAANATIAAHAALTNNPHNVTKSQVGLGNVDNTSDANKPVSTATQTALDTKLSLDGSTPMVGDINCNGNSITNVDQLQVATIHANGSWVNCDQLAMNGQQIDMGGGQIANASGVSTDYVGSADGGNQFYQYVDGVFNTRTAGGTLDMGGGIINGVGYIDVASGGMSISGPLYNSGGSGQVFIGGNGLDLQGGYISNIGAAYGASFVLNDTSDGTKLVFTSGGQIQMGTGSTIDLGGGTLLNGVVQASSLDMGYGDIYNVGNLNGYPVGSFLTGYGFTMGGNIDMGGYAIVGIQGMNAWALPVYTDVAAAVGDGRGTGDVFQTPDGVLMIVPA